MVFVGLVVACVLGLCAGLVEANSAPELKCAVPKFTSVKLSINSSRNQTGHWITQYDLKHGQESKAPRSVHMDVEHSTATCEDEEVVGIKATLTATPFRAVPSGYEHFPGLGYYKFHAKLATWQAAYDACVQEGTHLAMTNSEQETIAFQIMFARYPKIPGAVEVVHNDHAWLGFCEIGTNGKYFTLSGESINQAEFYRWSPSEPNNPTEFDCLLVNRNSGGFADAPRSWLGPFICEQEL